MHGLTVAEPKFPGDDGAADPAVLTALTAYAAGQGSEHAALTALAQSRLLVPVVAVLAGADEQGAEKSTEMALPTLVAQDGSRAVLAFTCLDVQHTSAVYFIDPQGRERFLASPEVDHTKSGASYLPASQQIAWGHGIALVARQLAR